MFYEITITETEIREVESGEKWTQVGEQLLTKGDLDQSIYNGVVVKKDEVKLKKVYGYTPKITRSETVTTEIYRQVVKELELPEVIRAINMMD